MARLLIIEGPDRGKEFQLEEIGDGSPVAGRDPRHAIAIADTTVSREHFRVERLSRGYRLVDLGSRNRTFINGEPVSEGLLRNGDVIAVGDSELRFEDDAEEVEVGDLVSTIIKEYASAGGDSVARIIDSLKVDPGLRRDRIQRAVESLRQIFNLSREILQSASVEDLYQKLLETLVPALEADRGVVMAQQADGKTWTPLAVHQPADRGQAGNGSTTAPRRAPASDDETVPEEAAKDPRRTIVVSDTVTDRVAREKKAILSRNVAQDERFQEGESILEGEIATVIAAPICEPGGGGKVLGILYADRRGPRAPFTEDDLHLLSAAADQAGGVVAQIESQLELRRENRNLIRSIASARPLVGKSAAISDMLAFIRKAAPTSMTVLLHGETGTGKDVVASAIHYQSPRKGKPFVAINCAALPDNLLESELFGYEKGAFTGATARKKGRFELAHTGTIFLDEIGELSPGCQAKLLRLLEERTFERVGGTQSIEVDVRIIAATNKDLGKAIEEGQFREDLFYRLNVLTVTLPPLRTRPQDIPLLAQHFLNEMGYGDDKKMLSAAAERKLLDYSWPGNVRQLRNVIESAAILKDGPSIQPADLVLPETRAPEATGETWRPETLEELQKRHIARVLEHTGGNKKRAAELLGIERCTLYSKLKSYGIQPKSS